MTIPGTDFLERLSGLAVSFVGFSSMVVALRRAIGAELSDLHLHFVRLFIEGGLAVAAMGLLPSALGISGLSEPTVWRASSAAAAVIFTVYLTFLYRRGRRVAPGPVNAQRVFNFVLSIVAVAALWVNALWLGRPPTATPYVLTLTWFLVLGGWVFLQNLELFFRQPPSR